MADCCLLNFCLAGFRKSFVYNYSSPSTIDDVKRWLQTGARLPQIFPVDDCYLTCQGHILNDDDVIKAGCHYQLLPRLVGGKGGFGSMLRAIGAQIEKTTNREACRDLSGRRMRDINNEKQLKEWMAKQVEHEKERTRRREERSLRLRETPKHQFEDQVYQKQKEKVSRDLEDAITAGLKRNGDTSSAESVQGGKKRKLESKSLDKHWNWIGINKDNLNDSDLSDDCDIAIACPSAAAFPSTSCTASTSAGSTSVDDCTDSNSSLSSTKFLSVPPEHEVTPSPDSSDNSTTNNSTGGSSSSSTTITKNPPPTTSKTEDEKEVASCTNNTDESTQQNGATLDVGEVLANADCARDLEVLGLDMLKAALQDRGMKCGGTLTERAQRLFAVKGLTPEQIDPSLLAKGKKNKKK
ncbi:splicing regulator SDE2 [Octopus bimaculoides]|uniref:Uncharacterized protein n=1 Tax=Octopus bimaculoides TaxID=37653 RepID=A0A0L8GY57_OCTBM|nr:splicing regulator SDE2 [Octopus bimaculoides]|eukprot:XP_014777005.1 PREDICTED: protein SDE2 homolog [Octopus bimaculoides]